MTRAIGDTTSTCGTCSFWMHDPGADGIYHKVDVTRTDGSSAPGGRHDGCFYFVLDLDHDPHARAALAAYAESCRAEYPKLAADLDVNLAQCDFGERT